MTAWCAGKTKQTTTPPPNITWLSVDSIQPDVMDVGVERTFSLQNFSMFTWATKSEDVGLIVLVISFQDFQPMWSWSTNVTDGQTDRETTCDRKTALCTVVHHAVKLFNNGHCANCTLSTYGALLRAFSSAIYIIIETWLTVRVCSLSPIKRRDVSYPVDTQTNTPTNKQTLLKTYTWNLASLYCYAGG